MKKRSLYNLPRRIQNEHHKLRLRDGKPMRPRRFRKPAHHRVHIFNIVDDRPVGMTQTIVDRRTVFVQLRVGDDLRCIANVRAVNLAQLRRPISCCCLWAAESAARLLSMKSS